MSMVSPTLRIPGLRPRSMAELRDQAKRKGLTPERYVRDLVEEHLAREHAARTMTFDELFAPVRARVKHVDDRELDELVRRARSKSGRRGRPRKRRGS